MWKHFVLAALSAAMLAGCASNAAKPASTEETAAFKGDPSKMPDSVRAQVKAKSQSKGRPTIPTTP